ncbi:MAG TPA: NAD(P)H:quinone oxidoreductase [Firmicutes bacterium]|nr:NAD(P)H:quinone oxidoreductase [Bacillota bacterium]
MKIQIVFHSMYGHIYRMAEAVAEGVRMVGEANAVLLRVPETIPDEILKKMGAFDAIQSFSHIPVANPDQLAEADGIIFGTPTRFGNMTGQMRTFLDRTGNLWAKGALIGKVGSVFTSSNTQHGGQETTITSFHSTLLHHGMIIVGVPYSEKGLSYVAEMSGGSPYGASTIASPDGSRMPSENELEIAFAQGKRVALITLALMRGRS